MLPNHLAPTALVLRRPRLSALVLGAAAATGFEPLHLWPVALAAMAGLFILVCRSAGWRAAAWYGWLFGFAHFTVGNNWIATAFTYQANMPPALGWAAVPLLSLYLALFPAFAAGAARAAGGSGFTWRAGLALGGAWTIGEWLRGWVLTGFPWNPFGIVLLGNWRAQGAAAIAPFVGTYTLSGIAVFLCAAGVVLLARNRLVPAGVLAGGLTAIMLWPAGAGRDGTIPLTLVQPDLGQTVINDPAMYEANFVKTASLSTRRRNGPRVLLWPEGGVPDYLRPGYPQSFYNYATVNGDPRFARRRLGLVAGPSSLLLTGTEDIVLDGGKLLGARNSVTAISGSGTIVGSYFKAHLVPFGEYLPFRPLLEPIGLSRLVPGSIDFLPGPGARTLDLGPFGHAGVQLCYEIVFSGHVVDPGERPEYIFNPSNDGWFGAWGPPQHLAQARLRAIEEGLPVLRSTTTGISAVVDARGIVRAAIPRNAPGRIDMMVPPARSPTLFSRTGNTLPVALGLLALAIALVAKRRRRA